MTDLEYTLSDFPNSLSTDDLSTELSSAGLSPVGISTSGESVMLHFDAPLSTAEETTLAGVIASHDGALAEAIKNKVKEIDAKTSNLIDQGFEFPPGSGDMYSLSLAAQSKLMALEIIKDDPAVAYPIEYNSKDDKKKYSMTAAADAHNFFLTALATVRAHLDFGTAKKDEVRAATTVAEVNAVVDPR